MIWALPLWLSVSLGLWAVSLSLLYFFLTNNFDHWKKKGVRYEKGLPFFGSLFSSMTLREHRIFCIDKIYKKFSGESFVGYFQGRQPALLINDPELIKSIVIKDFTYFHDRGIQVDDETNPLLAKNLFNLAGQRWKEMRSKMSPTFTSGKIKMMTPLMVEVGQILQQFLANSIINSNGVVNIKEITVCFTIDVIGSCVFGVQCNSIENPDTTFKVMGTKIVDFNFLRGLKAFCVFFVPEIAKTFRFEIIEKNLTNYFRNMVKEMIASREKTGQVRKDFLQMLIELKEKGSVSVANVEEENESRKLSGFEEAQPASTTTPISHDDLTAQATIFFIAGFETTSTIISLACLELALESECQQRAQAEIDQVLGKHEGRLTFDALREMVYLDCIIQETLRKYPPTGAVLRTCTKNYIIPGTNVRIDKGTPVMVPVYSIQNDPKYFPDPESFNPDRFSDDNALHNLQFLHMPFGDGPRHCIGMRFALVQIKIGLASILAKFYISPCKETVYPPKIDPIRPIISSQGGIHVRLEERK